MAQRKTQIPMIVSAVVGEDRRLVIDLPPDVPTGEVRVELIVHSAEAEPELPANPERERIRAKLLAAGLLSTVHNPPPGMHLPTDEEVRVAGILPPGARPSEELIAEDRNEA